MTGTEMIVIIVAITVGCWMIVELAKIFGKGFKELFGKGEPAESQLTTSELEGLVEGAVREAIVPLEEKVDRLEQQIEKQQKRLPEAPEADDRIGLIAEEKES